jgi:hypothetical protein
MAKRKAARATARKRASTRTSARRPRSRAAAAARKRQSAAPKAVARKVTPRKVATRKSVRNVAGQKVARQNVAGRKVARKKAAAPRTSPARGARAARSGGRPVVVLSSVRRAPALDRKRRSISDDDLFPMSGSSPDFDRTLSSARTDSRELIEQLQDHPETSPALTSGDIDADWAGAYAVGDETPGGDNQTPDQGIVDDIGKALGVQHEDNEELKGDEQISDRDKKRWELDPASTDDYEDR